MSRRVPTAARVQPEAREAERKSEKQNPEGRSALDTMAAKRDSPSRSVQGEIDSVARCTGLRRSTTVRTLTGGDGANAITLCSQYSKVVTRPGCMLDSCSAANLIHVDHVLNLQGPRIQKTNLSIRRSTGTGPAHGYVRQGTLMWY